MSDAKASEKGDRQDRSPDRVTAPDAQEARVAGAADMASAEKSRTNASDGSLRKYSADHIAAQEASIELVMPKKDGSYELLAARVMTPESSKVASDRPPEPKPPRPSDWEDQMNTGAIISAEAKKNPAVEPVALLKNWAEKLPDGAEKQTYKQLAREQLAQVSPEAKQKLDAMDEKRRLIAQSNQDEAGSFNINELREQALKGRVEEQKIIPENEWQVLKKLPPGYIDKLALAFDEASRTGQLSIEEQSKEICIRTGQAYIDTAIGAAKFPLDVLVAGGKAALALLEYDRELIFDPEKARQNASIAGENLGNAIISGVRISARVSAYGETVRESGDYSLPLTHLSNGLNAWYDKLSAADQMVVVSEVCAGFGIAAGTVEMNKLRKPGAFVEFLNEGASLIPRNPEAEKRAIGTIKRLVEQFAGKRKLALPGGGTFEDTVLESRIFQSPFNGRELTPGKAAEAAGIAKDEFAKLGPLDRAKVLVQRGFKLIEPKGYYQESTHSALTETQMAKSLGVKKEQLRAMTTKELTDQGITPIEPVNGNLPKNWKLAGKVIPLEKNFVNELVAKYPKLSGKGLEKGIEFAKDGYPKFSEFAKYSVELKQFTGDRRIDEAVANTLRGLRGTPKGYTWHHCSDKKTLELIPTPLHDKIRHSGGQAMSKELR